MDVLYEFHPCHDSLNFWYNPNYVSCVLCDYVEIMGVLCDYVEMMDVCVSFSA